MKIRLIIVLSLFLSACHHENNSIQAQEDLTYELGDIIPISNDYILFPVLTSAEGKWLDTYSTSVKRSYSLKTFNYLFHHIETEESHLLTDQLNFFYSYHVLANAKDTLLLFHLVDEDTNEDDMLDNQDFSSLYIANIDGSEYRKISPDKEHVVSWKAIKDNEIIILRTFADTNQNHEIDEEDEIKVYRLSKNNLFLPTNVVSPEIEQQIFQLLETQL